MGSGSVLLGDLAGIASAVLWALTSSTFGGLARRVPPVALSALRLLVGSVCCLVLVLVAGKTGELAHLGWDRFAALIAMAWIGLGLGDTLYITGVQTIGVGRASPVSVSSYPLITIFVAWIALGETLSARGAMAAVLIIAGICLVVTARTPAPDDADVLEAEVSVGGSGAPVAVAPAPARSIRGRVAGEERALWLGLGLILASATAWAVSTVWIRALSLHSSAVVLNAVRVPAAAALLSAEAARRGTLRPSHYRARDLALVAFAGIVGTGFGTLLFVYALQEAGTVRATLLNSLMPVFALPIAVWVLKERVTRRTLAGTGVALAGVWLVIG